MNTSEINDEMKEIECYIGTYSIDTLPNKHFDKRPLALIFNLDPHYESGSHWVSLFIDENKVANYFDSFGFPNFKIEILDFLRIQNVTQIIFNKFVLQSVNSSTCGAHCIIFLKMRCNGFSMNDFLSLYSNNFKQNDNISIKILN